MFKDIQDFHEKFGFAPRAAGERPDPKLVAFRLKFLMEELHELKQALVVDDLEETLDALVDIVYVALGTAWLLNLDFEYAWHLVHEANMKKIRVDCAADSKRGSAFDVKKPDGWQKPQLRACLAPDDRHVTVWKNGPRKREKAAQLDLLDYLKELEGAAYLWDTFNFHCCLCFCASS